MFTKEVFSVIQWLGTHTGDLVLTGWSRKSLDYTCGNGGYTIAFTMAENQWYLDHVNGESVEMLISDDADSLIDRLNSDANTPTIYYSCNPDDPTDFVTSFVAEEAKSKDTFGDTIAPDSTEIDMTDEDAIQDLIYAATFSDGEILVMCRGLAYYCAISTLLIPEKEKWSRAWEAYTVDQFGGESDIERHGNLFCQMVGLAFGADAEKSQREAFATVNFD